MSDYKKRARSGWSAGKSYKRDSNRSERQFEKDEIREELQELEEQDNYRYKHKSKKKLTFLERKEKQLAALQLYLNRWRRRTCEGPMVTRIINSYRNRVDQLKKQIKELRD